MNEDIIKMIKNHFGNRNWTSNKENIIKSDPEIQSSRQKKHIIEKSNSVQSAIRMGHTIINKQHSDYPGLQILNTILGGYFGSRLMSNIREEKGYTYGIGSIIGSLVHSGYFAIITEVGSDVTKSTVNEIYKEIKKLKNELVSEKELETVRSYILGELLKIFDGPFALSEALRSIIDFGLDYDYFDHYINTVKNIQPAKLNELANQYFDENKMIEVIAGKYK